MEELEVLSPWVREPITVLEKEAPNWAIDVSHPSTVEATPAERAADAALILSRTLNGGKVCSLWLMA